MILLAAELRFFPEQASTIARQVDLVFLVLLALSAFFGIGVVLLIIFFSIKYRAQSMADRSGRNPQNRALEVLWTLIPLGIAMGMFVWGAAVYLEIQKPPPGEALEIYAVGKQWMWKFQHKTGAREINELHVPANTPIKLTMISQDVIHSFYVPAFRTKQDLLPGRVTQAWFEAVKPGEFQLFCAEYCGTQHSRMEGKVYVMEPSAFEEWLRLGATPGAETGAPADTAGAAFGDAGLMPLEGETMGGAGAALFESLRCNACHRTDSTASEPVVAPVLEGVYGSLVALQSGREITADEQYIIESILDPKAKIVQGYPPVMPTYAGQVTATQLTQLVEYIKSLSSQEAQP